MTDLDALDMVACNCRDCRAWYARHRGMLDARGPGNPLATGQAEYDRIRVEPPTGDIDKLLAELVQRTQARIDALNGRNAEAERQAAVPGGLIGQAGVEPSGTVYRPFKPRGMSAASGTIDDCDEIDPELLAVAFGTVNPSKVP